MAQTLISMKDDLKARMDAARDAGLVDNWSKILANAAEAHLAGLATGPGRAEAIAARMVATDRAAKDKEASIGRADGIRWGEVCASSGEMLRLSILVEGETFDWRRVRANHWATFFDASHGSMPGADARLVAFIENDHPAPVRSEVFWNRVAALDPTRATIRVNRSNSYVKAFAIGAMSVWSEVSTLVMNELLRGQSSGS